jgi:hypothetical protein
MNNTRSLQNESYNGCATVPLIASLWFGFWLFSGFFYAAFLFILFNTQNIFFPADEIAYFLEALGGLAILYGFAIPFAVAACVNTGLVALITFTIGFSRSLQVVTRFLCASAGACTTWYAMTYAVGAANSTVGPATHYPTWSIPLFALIIGSIEFFMGKTYYPETKEE